MLISIVVALFVNTRTPMTMIYAVLCCAMALFLGCSFKYLSRYLKILEQNRLRVSSKTLKAQLVLISVIGVLNVASFSAYVNFMDQCSN